MYLVNNAPHESYILAFRAFVKAKGKASVKKGRKDLTDEFEYIYTQMYLGKTPAQKKELLDCMEAWNV